mgnify:CR=1 FL=1
MERLIAFLVFIGIFLLLFFGGHLYVFWRMSSMLGIKRGILFWFVLLFMTFSFIGANILNSRFHNLMTKILYSLTASWLGIMLFTIMLLLIYEIVRIFFDIDSKLAGYGIIGIVMLISLVALMNGMVLNTRHIGLEIAGLEKETRIVQLSDVHVGTLRNSAFLSRVVDAVNREEPDMILITGDLVDGSAPLWDLGLDELKRLEAKTYFSVGNHERYEGLDKVLPIIEAQNITILRNRMEIYKGIQLIGIDDPSDEFKKANALLAEIDFDRAKPSILMFHRPIGYKEAAERGISLQLSGHTHSGQIFPFILGTRLAFKYTSGLHRFNETFMYVSPGTGTWGPPMRLGSRNEITVFTLKPAIVPRG